jgi:hypothetical protein
MKRRVEAAALVEAEAREPTGLTGAAALVGAAGLVEAARVVAALVERERNTFIERT